MSVGWVLTLFFVAGYWCLCGVQVERLLKASLAKLANVNDDIAKRITKVEKEISMQVGF